MAVENKGNLITRRAFHGEHGKRMHRALALHEVTGKAMPTVYQMMVEATPFNTWRPSPLHVVCEMIRRSHDFDRRESSPISYARELAEYPLEFLRELIAETEEGNAPAAGGDSVAKVNSLLKEVADANFLLRGRLLADLTPGEAKELRERLMGVVTLGRELQAMTEAALRRAEEDYPGAPIQGERLARRVAAPE